MSKVNIKRAVGNISGRTNVYTPIIEAIVNSIQSIQSSGRTDGEITISIERELQQQVDERLSDIQSIKIIDNGIGFNEENRLSFDELYSELKQDKGCKGFGRFTFLKYFESVKIESIFKSLENKYQESSFDFGIENYVCNESFSACDTETTLYFNDLKKRNQLDKKLDTLARKILQNLLIFFTDKNYSCPKVVLKESDNSNQIILNEYIENTDEIQEVGQNLEFQLKKDHESKSFSLKVFKIFYPSNERSKISLTGHRREITENSLHKYVPEFEDDFYEESVANNEGVTKKNYIIKSYVLGEYLDSNISVEQNAFNFPINSKEGNLLFPFSKEEIEKKVAELTKELFEKDIKLRKNKKQERINKYVDDDAPWHKPYLKDIDTSQIQYNPTNEQIEMELHKAKFHQESKVIQQAKSILDNPEYILNENSVKDLVANISKAQMSELTHYVALRKATLGLLRKSLEIQADGKYPAESCLHNILYPTRSDSNLVDYNKHNLWIIDEKLSFTEFISSEEPLNGGNSERPDLLIYNKQIAYRGENEVSNPITIFEFKKPQRDDFANPSSKEDPVKQIIRYVNSMREGNYRTPTGRNIKIEETTPFYGFIICDLTEKVKKLLRTEHNFKVLPDGEGWFTFRDNIHLYIEVVSWDKLLKDAEMRNKIFFHKLKLI
jgi:hypothetical protein